MDKWAQFYSNRLNKRYLDHITKKYGHFIDVIKTTVTDTQAQHIAEFGCGIGTISKLLINDNVGLKHYLIDNSREMLNLTHQNLTNLEFEMYLHNILKPFEFVDKLDLIHSHGVLEHFEDEQIRTIIKHQKEIAKTLIHYVPSYKYEKPSFGDERLLTIDKWAEICQPDKVVEFNDGYDLILIWKGNR